MGLAGAPQANIASWKFGGGIRFYDADDSHYAGFKAASTITGSIDYTLPVAPPAGDGYRLIATTAGIMSWANGANLTASTGISITSGSGTAALLVAATLAVDQAFTPTWTGLHTYTTNGVKFNFTNAGDTVLSSFVGAASVAALLVTTDGTMFWGPGSGAVDVALSRTGAAQLAVTGTFNVSTLTASRVVATDASKNLVSVGAPASNGYVLSSTTAGVLSWVAQGAPASFTLTAGTGLSGTTANALLAAATLAVDQAFTPTWTGLHIWKAGTRISTDATYETFPEASLQGWFKYNAAGTQRQFGQITFGKENDIDGNDAGYFAIATRANGGSVANKMTVSSAGVINIDQMTASRYLKSSSGKNISTTETETANFVFAGPTSGGAAVPTFRALVAADVGTISPTSVNGQTTGVGTDYQLTGTMAQVVFGTTSCTISIADGTYLVTAVIQLGPNGATNSDNVQFKLYNSTDTADVANSTRFGWCAANSYSQIILKNIITVSGTKTIQIYGAALGGLGALEPWVLAINTSISKIKLSN